MIQVDFKIDANLYSCLILNFLKYRLKIFKSTISLDKTSSQKQSSNNESEDY